MRKHILTFISLCVCGFMSMSATPITYFECDFGNGIPEDFTLVDTDCRDLHFTMTQLGFSDKDSWISLREEGTENYFAASASRFKTSKGEDPAPAEDWMITPPVWIRSADAVLSWRGMSVNERNSNASSYEVLISVDGSAPDDFTSGAVAFSGEEKIFEWTRHEAPLGDFVGQRVRIAFVNRSTESDVLAIDDICVEGESGIADLEIIPGDYTLGNEEIAFGGRLTATSEEPVNTLSISFEVGEDTFHAEYEGLNLHEGETFEFMLPETVAARYGDELPFTVKSEVNGVAFDDMSLSTMLLAFLPTKRVIVEEATGMWCGYCPEGIVAMETLKEKYPGQFIGVAVHVDDRLAVPGYADAMTFPDGAPTAWVDRVSYCNTLLTPINENGAHTYTTLMGGLESVFLDRLSQQAFADVDVEADYDDVSGEVTASVSARFARKYEACDFRIVLLMTEDDVWKEGYYQTNYHSGRDELLGGFESLPAMIEDNFSFSDVARFVAGDYTGAEGSLPAELKPGENYAYSTSFQMPRTVLAMENVKLIAMVADASTGEIMNVSSAAIGGAGVGGVNADGIRLHKENGILTAVAEGTVSMAVFDVAGNKVSFGEGVDSVCAGELSSGIYIVKIMAGNSTKTVKIVI